MQNINLVAPIEDPVFALVYGGSGTGKTHFAGTIGALGPTLIIDVDKGSKTIRTAKDIRNAQWFKNLWVTTFDKFQDLDHAYRLLQKNDATEWSKVLGVEADAVPTDGFKWIVWDSWSELQWNMMQQLRTEKSMQSTTLGFRKNLEIQHWGMLTDLNKLSVESLREVRTVNQVFVMLETMSKDELSGQVFGGPAIHGKLVAEFPGYFDVVVHTYTDVQGKYMATTKSKGRWPAKTRLGEGKDLQNPTAKDFFVIVP